MSRDHSGCIRGFHQNSRAWYARFKRSKIGPEPRMVLEDGMVDCFSFGLYHSDGSTTGEMLMCFVELDFKVVPRLKCYDDGWGALASFAAIIARMGTVSDQNITPDDFRKLLLECGFTDLTKEKQE